MHRYRALTLVAIAELLAMGLWFGVSAVAPEIANEWRLDPATTAWLTLAVQLGFVAGTLLSATLNLPDVISVRRLFAICALLGALANLLLVMMIDERQPRPSSSAFSPASFSRASIRRG